MCPGHRLHPAFDALAQVVTGRWVSHNKSETRLFSSRASRSCFYGVSSVEAVCVTSTRPKYIISQHWPWRVCLDQPSTASATALSSFLPTIRENRDRTFGLSAPLTNAFIPPQAPPLRHQRTETGLARAYLNRSDTGSLRLSFTKLHFAIVSVYIIWELSDRKEFYAIIKSPFSRHFGTVDTRNSTVIQVLILIGVYP